MYTLASTSAFHLPILFSKTYSVSNSKMFESIWRREYIGPQYVSLNLLFTFLTHAYASGGSFLGIYVIPVKVLPEWKRKCRKCLISFILQIYNKLRKERKKANLWERGSSLWLSLDRGGPLTAFSRCLLLPSSLHSGGSTVQFSDFFWIPTKDY